MEERKKIEIDHYNKKGEELLAFNNNYERGDFEGFDPFIMASYRFLPKYLKDKCKDKELLDYGCGNAVHSFWLAKLGARVTAIDLSEKLLEVAKKEKENLCKDCNVKFVLMDCEKLEFRDNSFDIIFDGGSFSSLDLNNALPELSRVLRPDGFLIGIETFGHNPITNLKRELNKLLGKRTGWAASHIFSLNDIELSKKYFIDVKVYYFHVISWLAIPFLKIRFFRSLLKFLELIDKVLLRLPFFKKYSFKVVVVFSKPKK
jgi:SAM-dependent methyltransferase